MNKWKPIESAPKDGETVLAYHKNIGSHTVSYRLPVRGEPGNETDYRKQWRDSSGRYFNPTHWMPLPEPPK